MPDFVHLHVHSQYSLLDGAASISGMMKKAAADNMKAIALTDHGNMFGAFNFVNEANKYNIKPIIGCEFYLVEDRHKKEFTKEAKDNRFHQLILAKDQEGYRNLSKLCSLGYMEGLYSKWPRIDRELIKQYNKGLIATTCCIGAEVPQAILHKTEEEAEKVFQYWLDIFGEDYYIELQRHNLENIDNTGKSQEDVNQVLLKWARKYNVKVIATNDSHYIDQEDWTAHDILLCVNTGELRSTPIGEGKNERFGFPNNQFYFKTQDEMAKLFADVPEALDNTYDIVSKVQDISLKRDILLPNYKLPESFADADDYLRHLTFEGAKTRYAELTPDLEERLNYELNVIKTMGFAGYFLIVQDFIAAGRNMGVAVGPGRGSAAGSAVAFCIGITNIDPVKYNLLFERFLNPERVTMPDIDIDFDDEGRQKVIDYVVDKYGKNQVAQIITFGTMAAKSAIKDVARVLDLPLPEANALTKLVPDGPGISLAKAYADIKELTELKKGNDLKAETLQLAERLEGSVRNTGIHAAGVIIAPDDLTNYIPVSTSKDSDLLVTQFDGKLIESAGMLKMDFLGLRTLSILRDALALIRKNHGTEIDIDEIPLDDLKTFELYQRGDTIGTFQFESDGMRTYLKDLKPTNIEDLIAMNALFRPGPMEFIPLFIKRKHGKEKVEYPHPLLESILSYTYGIMVYQEQIMQTAQIIAGYSLGGADLLRRAMGKKDREKMAKEREKFVKGAKEKNGIEKKEADRIFDVMEKFAEYGFNRSHSAAYSVVAYQTAYLKANYPGEYMAAVLTHNMSSIEKISFFMDECKRQNIPVLGPDINESAMHFDVNKEGAIRFGLAAIKGTGEAAVEAIISERNENGPFKDIFDFSQRVNLRTVNKKTFECLAQAGAFDRFDLHRAQYFFVPQNEQGTQIEKLIRYGAAYQADKMSSTASLFGGSVHNEIQKPKILDCDRWNKIEELSHEKDVVGIYISAHPLDDYRIILDKFATCTVSDLNDIPSMKVKQVYVGGVVTKLTRRRDKNNKEWGILVLEDFSGSAEVRLWSSVFLKFQHLLNEGSLVFMRGDRQKARYNDEIVIEWADVQFLDEITEKMTKSISLHVNAADVSEKFYTNLEHVFTSYAGNCPVKLTVTDETENVSMTFSSEKFFVQPTHDCLKTLAGIREIKLGLN